MDKFEVRFTKKAEKDFAQILSYIAEDSIDNALNFVEQLITKITDTLSLMPYAGTLFGKRRGHDVRTLVVHKSYTAFYVVSEKSKTVEVISVFNTYKDEQKFWETLKTQGIRKKRK